MTLLSLSSGSAPQEIKRRLPCSSRSLRARHVIFSVCLAITLGISGCLMYETVDYRIHLNPDGKGGTITITYKNIESTSDDSAKQQEDFQELLDKWKGDEYLLERMNEGVYIKRRELKLVKGILVWKEVGIFSDAERMKEGISYNDTSRIELGKDETVLSTNGTLFISKDSTMVVWPPHTRDFSLVVQNKDFKPTSHFAERFRKLKKK
jgi:hypothetical protein